MIVRTGTLRDIPEIVDSVQNFVAASSYKLERVNVEHVQETLRRMLAAPDEALVVILETDQGQYAGVFLGLAHSHLFSGAKMFGELFIYTLPSARGHGNKLRVFAEEWARERECRAFSLAHPMSESHLVKVYDRWGFQPYEVHYRKDLN